jgi:chemotaxis response regulator CheB
LIRKKILLFAPDTLLGSAVSSLISDDQELELTSLPETDPARLISVSQALKPDVIILEQRILASKSGLLKGLLNGRKDFKVIAFDERENTLHVYSSHDVSLEQASDLLSILHSNNHNC